MNTYEPKSVASSRCGLGIVLLIAGVGASACTDTLYYGERSSFKMAIHVNDNPVTPIQVNMGVKRTVVAIAPPRGERNQGGQRRPDGEAVNLFSGFDLQYDRPATWVNPFAGTLTIKAQFASGDAALSIAGDPNTVKSIVEVAKFEPLPPTLVPRIGAAIRAINQTRDNAKLNRLAAELKIAPGAAAREELKELIRGVRTEAQLEPIADAIQKHLGTDIRS